MLHTVNPFAGSDNFVMIDCKTMPDSHMQNKPCINCYVMLYERERSGSVVECLTQDRRAAGSSLTRVTELWSLTHLSQLSTGTTQEVPSLYN